MYMHDHREHHEHRKLSPHVIPRILFILKFRQTSSGEGTRYSELKSSGLLNSARFVSEMLNSNKFESKVVQVVDNNSIDREVRRFRPSIVIIEALWLVPEKFDILRRLYPSIKWIVRVHSEIPFLANEGIAMNWINRYITTKNVFLSFNSLQTHINFVNYFDTVDPCRQLSKHLIFLPNYYPIRDLPLPVQPNPRDTGIINIGCFGAVRPMKNQLLQAFAAVQYANIHNLKCYFHINAGRVERGGEVLKNLRSFFNGLHGVHELVEHDWLEREDFMRLVRSMDIGLQMSLSETFNIVAADFVSEGVPILTSPEIDWMPKQYTAISTDVDDIIRGIHRVMRYDRYFSWFHSPKKSLEKYVESSRRSWLNNLKVVL